jgi:hypothetical protein
MELKAKILVAHNWTSNGSGFVNVNDASDVLTVETIEGMTVSELYSFLGY